MSSRSSVASGRNTELIVVDASVVVQAALSEVGLEPLIPQGPVAPPLLWSEATSALHELVYRGEVTHDVAQKALERIVGGYIGRRAPRGLCEQAWRIASELGWAKTYDAEYIALARSLNCRLVSADAGMRSSGRKYVQVIGPAEL